MTLATAEQTNEAPPPTPLSLEGKKLQEQSTAQERELNELRTIQENTRAIHRGFQEARRKATTGYARIGETKHILDKTEVYYADTIIDHDAALAVAGQLLDHSETIKLPLAQATIPLELQTNDVRDIFVITSKEDTDFLTSAITRILSKSTDDQPQTITLEATDARPAITKHYRKSTVPNMTLVVSERPDRLLNTVELVGDEVVAAELASFKTPETSTSQTQTTEQPKEPQNETPPTPNLPTSIEALAAGSQQKKNTGPITLSEIPDVEGDILTPPDQNTIPLELPRDRFGLPIAPHEQNTEPLAVLQSVAEVPPNTGTPANEATPPLPIIDSTAIVLESSTNQEKIGSLEILRKKIKAKLIPLLKRIAPIAATAALLLLLTLPGSIRENQNAPQNPNLAGAAIGGELAKTPAETEQSTQGIEYTVQTGDGVWNIADHCGTTIFERHGINKHPTTEQTNFLKVLIMQDKGMTEGDKTILQPGEQYEFTPEEVEAMEVALEITDNYVPGDNASTDIKAMYENIVYTAKYITPETNQGLPSGEIHDRVQKFKQQAKKYLEQQKLQKAFLQAMQDKMKDVMATY